MSEGFFSFDEMPLGSGERGSYAPRADGLYRMINYHAAVVANMSDQSMTIGRNFLSVGGEWHDEVFLPAAHALVYQGKSTVFDLFAVIPIEEALQTLAPHEDVFVIGEGKQPFELPFCGGSGARLPRHVFERICSLFSARSASMRQFRMPRSKQIMKAVELAGGSYGKRDGFMDVLLPANRCLVGTIYDEWYQKAVPFYQIGFSSFLRLQECDGAGPICTDFWDRSGHGNRYDAATIAVDK